MSRRFIDCLIQHYRDMFAQLNGVGKIIVTEFNMAKTVVIGRKRCSSHFDCSFVGCMCVCGASFYPG